MEIELGHTTGLDHARSIHQALLLSLEVIRHWAEKIPGFSELNKDDQNHLLETAFLQLFVARLGYRCVCSAFDSFDSFAFRSEPQEGKFILCHGVALHRNQLLPSFGEWIDVIHGFSSQVHNVNIDISAFSCLCALILFRTNGKHTWTFCKIVKINYTEFISCSSRRQKLKFN